MSTAELINTCPACGAEDGLDSVIARMLDDDEVRRLIRDVLTASLPVGGLVVRYLRLHKPAKQKLRMSRVRAVLAELVPDVQRGAITRKGREWQAPMQAWHNAFAAVFDAHQKGTLDLPLEGNAYLYEVVMRQADRAEGQQEREQHEEAKRRMHLADVVGPCAVPPMRVGAASAAMQPLHTAIAAEAAPTEGAAARPAPEPGTSPLVRRMKAEREAALARRAQPTEGQP